MSTVFTDFRFTTPSAAFLGYSLTLGVVILSFLLFSARWRGFVITALARRALRWKTQRRDIDISIRAAGYAVLAGKLHLNGVVIRTPNYSLIISESVLNVHWWMSTIRTKLDDSQTPSRLHLQLIGCELVVYHNSSVYDDLEAFARSNEDVPTHAQTAAALDSAVLSVESTLSQLVQYIPVTSISLTRFACSFGNIRLPCQLIGKFFLGLSALTSSVQIFASSTLNPLKSLTNLRSADLSPLMTMSPSPGLGSDYLPCKICSCYSSRIHSSLEISNSWAVPPQILSEFLF